MTTCALPTVKVAGWSALAPRDSLSTCETSLPQDVRALFSDGPGKLPFVDPLHRRRMSLLDRLAMAAAYECLGQARTPPSEVRLVFGSRHGETGVLVGLLKSIHQGDALSPTAFSVSVHHAFTGFFSMIAGNRHSSRAIAAGEETFCCGFLEAVGQLMEDETPVLFVTAEDALPTPFGPLVRSPEPAHAVALLLTRAGPADRGISLSIVPGGEQTGSGWPVGDFLFWHRSEASDLRLSFGARTWAWAR